MTQLIARRVLMLVPLWLGITLLAFLLGRLAPATLVANQRAGGVASQDQIDATRRELGLDLPLPLQYTSWLFRVVRGDLGVSYRTGGAVLDEFASRLPATLELALAGFAVSVVLALPLGVLAASHRNGIWDHITRLVALAGASMPGFWLAFLLILVFAVKVHWLPVLGRGTWQQLVLPAVALGFGAAAGLTRLMRSSMLEVLGEDYVRTARAKGVGARGVLLHHALRNALIPIITVLGLRFGFLLSGAAVIEVVFAWPGIGRLMVEGIAARDYPLIQGYVLFTGTIFLLVNLLVDLAYGWLNPRIRVEAAIGAR